MSRPIKVLLFMAGVILGVALHTIVGGRHHTTAYGWRVDGLTGTMQCDGYAVTLDRR